MKKSWPNCTQVQLVWFSRANSCSFWWPIHAAVKTASEFFHQCFSAACLKDLDLLFFWVVQVIYSQKVFLFSKYWKLNSSLQYWQKGFCFNFFEDEGNWRYILKLSNLCHIFLTWPVNNLFLLKLHKWFILLQFFDLYIFYVQIGRVSYQWFLSILIWLYFKKAIRFVKYSRLF